MRLLYAPDNWRAFLDERTWAEACVATIGNFDGLHLGHRALVGQAVARARELSLPSLAISFEPHPARFFGKGGFLPLQSLEQRLETLAATGLDALLLLPFTRDLAALSASEFSREILRGKLRLRELFLGYDFHMGHDKAGAGRLAEYGKKDGYRVTRVDAVMHEGTPVSSSRIREALAEGDLLLANAMLGRPYAVRGIVERGHGRGGPLLGFPTANQNIRDQAMPLPAIYATTVCLMDRHGARTFAPGAAYELPPGLTCSGAKGALPSMTSFGKNPTFGKNELSLETHILSFHDDIYGRVLEVSFLRKMRGEIAFSDPEELKARLRADLDERRQLDMRVKQGRTAMQEKSVLKCSVKYSAPAQVITLEGRWDAFTSPGFEDFCAGRDKAEALGQVVLDLSGVDYVNSFGLHSLLNLGKKLEKRHGAIHVANLRPEVREVFPSIFPEYPSVGEAVKAFLSKNHADGGA